MATSPAIGELVDNRFRVKGLCSNSGGMGTVFHVADEESTTTQDLVLKYCKALDEGSIRRFRRESRILDGFKGNGKVAQLYSLNAEQDPPYYVMRRYKDGDLALMQSAIASDAVRQEEIFLQMIDCVAELHAREVFHRDIKPSNFLVDGNSIVVSDLGLSMERESRTQFTSSADAWGTQGYMPPEYLQGGFKHADAPGDIFMLGKSFYVLLTGRDPMYLVKDGIHQAIFHVINTCCSIDKTLRYQRLPDLKQALVFAFDVVLDRVHGLNEARRDLAAITDRLGSESKYNTKQVRGFINKFVSLNSSEREELAKTIPPRLFRVVSGEAFADQLDSFLQAYDEMVRKNNYGWTFSEVIADCAKAMISTGNAAPAAAAYVLDSAIHAAVHQNQFAAMDTCKEIITGIFDDGYAQAVRPILLQGSGTFVSSIESVRCKHTILAEAVQLLKEADGGNG